MKTVFISGASGFIGSYIVEKALQSGIHVKTLSHKKNIALKTENITGDILKPETFSSHLKDVNVVINLVGIIKEIPAKNITFETMHFQATKNLVDAAKEAGVKKFIQMSANGARENASSMYHLSKFKAEEYLKKSGLEFTIFRPSVVYGKGDSFITMLAGLMRKTPVFSYFGKGDYLMQPVSVEEVSEAFVKAITMPIATGKTYELGGDRVLTYKNLLEVIAKAINKKILFISVPEKLVSCAITLFGRFSFFPITRDQFIMLKEGNTCTDASAFSELDIKYKDFTKEIKTYL